MFRQVFQRSFVNGTTAQKLVCKRFNATAAASTETPKEKWDIFAGVLVERLPVITKSLTEIEQQYQVGNPNSNAVTQQKAHHNSLPESPSTNRIRKQFEM